MSELEITLADGRRLRHEVPETPETVGRDATCDIPLDDPSASRRHARFVPTSDGLQLEDLGSKNGTLVNDIPLERPKKLQDGDRILVGSTQIVFRTTRVPTGSVVIADNLTETHATRYAGPDKELMLSRKRLEMIYELTARLTTLRAREQLLEDAMDICFETLNFERGAVGLRRENSRAVDWPVVRNLRGAEGELTISRTLLSRALEHGERAIFTDSGGQMADPTVSMVQHGIRSAMCVPLIQEDEILGVVYGDRTTTSTSYSDEDIDFFAGIAQQVTIGLINTRLMRAQEQSIRLNHDIDLARRIQNGLFPTALPDHDKLKVVALNEPGARVSGDYYDVIEREDGRVWCLIADVTGEGVAAAMLTANLQAAVRVTVEAADDPAALLQQWNTLIYRNTDPSKFITCVLLLVDPATRTMHCAGAGHCPLILVNHSTQSTSLLEDESTFPLGVVEDAEYATKTVALGDDALTVFGYTDGVIEAMDIEQNQFGADRLVETLCEQSESNPTALIKLVRKRVANFAGTAPQSDDITMLAVSLPKV